MKECQQVMVPVISLVYFKPEKDRIEDLYFIMGGDGAICIYIIQTGECKNHKDERFIMDPLFLLLLPVCDNVTKRFVVQVACYVDVGRLEHLLYLKLFR